jgi:hypothetical protein
VVLKFQSVNNIVIAEAKTGNDSSSKKDVIRMDQTNKFNLWNLRLFVLMLIIVQIKFIAPNKDAIPAKCKLKIAKSTEPPECDIIPDKGGYTVHPVPTPVSHNIELTSSIKEEGKSRVEN